MKWSCTRARHASTYTRPLPSDRTGQEVQTEGLPRSSAPDFDSQRGASVVLRWSTPVHPPQEVRTPEGRKHECVSPSTLLTRLCSRTLSSTWLAWKVDHTHPLTERNKSQGHFP